MTLPAPLTVLTIGHSTNSYEHFLGLLRQARVTAIADVRSSPFSRRFPHFSRNELKASLRRDGIAYSFLGKELGGRPRGSRFFRNGVADYEAMASTAEFERGLARVLQGAGKYRLALMCAERHPVDCHRCLLVGRALSRRCMVVEHLLPDGSVATQLDIEVALLKMAASDHEDLFASRDERLNAAYRERAGKVAFGRPAEHGAIRARV